MKYYEYKWVYIETGYSTPHDKELTKLGKEGWRVVPGSEAGMYYLMEREIENAPYG